MTTIVNRENKQIYRDGDTLVKVFDEKAYTKAQVLNEALNTARVEETGLKIPKLLDVRKVDGGWAITREYIEGKSLSELMAENPEKRTNILKNLLPFKWKFIQRNALCSIRLRKKCTPKSAHLLMKLL